MKHKHESFDKFKETISDEVHLVETQGDRESVDTPSVDTTDLPHELVTSYIEGPISDTQEVVEEPTIRRSDKNHQQPDRWYEKAFLVESDEHVSYEEQINTRMRFGPC
ncbi:hypothetical protein LIER_20134 [Lithospermum erythrorhizon]|uniref:Uncharacterized protein n=1 Tax=Lithospermum erythrorhizon TaxID=34254 RepID=A0AAV3QPL2_LITER